MTEITRRNLLRGLGILPFGVILAACDGGGTKFEAAGEALERAGDQAIAAAEPTSPPEPFVVAAGEARRVLMVDTPQETPLYIYGTGRPGPVLMALGGVHGNEPGGWQAAERVVEAVRPENGALLVVPRANKLAVNLFERTTPELGDLNRLYPGDPNGLPMERMAFQIVETLREFHATVLVDMHESWAFYKDRPQNGTAFLGQTVATRSGDAGMELARAVVDAVNTRIHASHEELFFREFSGNRPPSDQGQPFDMFGVPPAPSGGNSGGGGGRSSLGLPQHIPGLTALLVEMGQQQLLERRVALHLDVLGEVMRRVGMAA
jgi:hypothetical protein